MSKNNYVLIHGQLVEVSDDVLMHWKYIKRVRKNGRWVYYYDNSDENRAKESLDKAKKQYDRAALNKKDAEGWVESAGTIMGRHLSDPNRDTTITRDIFDHHTAAQSNYDKAVKAYARTGNSYYKAQSTYQKYKTKDLAKKTIAKGAVKVANFFSKLFSKKK